MTGKQGANRGKAARDVRLRIGGEEVAMNGFVEDVFQETIVGLIRALGTHDEDSRIELSIGPSEAKREG